MKFQISTILLAVSCVLAFEAPARAADKQELQARFERRYPQLLSAKTRGQLGETMQGYIDAVDSKARQDQAVAKLMDEENADRRELYKLIATEEKTTPELVAERTARRNYEKARPGEYLKSADGMWKKKS